MREILQRLKRGQEPLLVPLIRALSLELWLDQLGGKVALPVPKNVGVGPSRAQERGSRAERDQKAFVS
jgi:hypothetical protein